MSEETNYFGLRAHFSYNVYISSTRGQFVHHTYSSPFNQSRLKITCRPIISVYVTASSLGKSSPADLRQITYYYSSTASPFALLLTLISFHDFVFFHNSLFSMLALLANRITEQQSHLTKESFNCRIYLLALVCMA